MKCATETSPLITGLSLRGRIKSTNLDSTCRAMTMRSSSGPVLRTVPQLQQLHQSSFSNGIAMDDSESATSFEVIIVGAGTLSYSKEDFSG